MSPLYLQTACKHPLGLTLTANIKSERNPIANRGVSFWLKVCRRPIADIENKLYLTLNNNKLTYYLYTFSHNA